MRQLIEDKNIDASNTYFSDLNDSKVIMSDFKGKPILITGGAQRATKESTKWGKALRSAYDDSAVFINVAFITRQPPASMMTSIKNQLKRGYGQVPFLISWGNPSDIVSLTNENMAHIFLIDREGYLRIKIAENYSEKNLSELKEMIDKFV